MLFFAPTSTLDYLQHVSSRSSHFQLLCNSVSQYTVLTDGNLPIIPTLLGTTAIRYSNGWHIHSSLFDSGYQQQGGFAPLRLEF